MTTTSRTGQKLYRIVLFKAYFDKGWGLMNYPKYILFLVGAGDVIQSGGDYTNVLIAGGILFLFLFLFGKWAYKYGWVAAELEVENKVNPFVNEMRKNYK